MIALLKYELVIRIYDEKQFSSRRRYKGDHYLISAITDLEVSVAYFTE